MFDIHVLNQGDNLSTRIDFNLGNTVLLLFFLAIGIMLIIRYPVLRKLGLKIILAIVLIYGGYNAGILLGFKMFKSQTMCGICGIFGTLLGFALFLTSTKVINDKYNQ